MERDQQRKMKKGLGRRMKDQAVARQCPKCERKMAVSVERDDVGSLRYCRYCDWAEYRYFD